MEFLNKKNWLPRRKYLKWLGGSLAGISMASFFFRSKKPKKVKMLTTDGKLVEIPQDKLPGNRRKATKQEVKTWIWNHNS